VRSECILFIVGLAVAALLVLSVLALIIMSVFEDELKAYIYMLTFALAPLGLFAGKKAKERR